VLRSLPDAALVVKKPRKRGVTTGRVPRLLEEGGALLEVAGLDVALRGVPVIPALLVDRRRRREEPRLPVDRKRVVHLTELFEKPPALQGAFAPRGSPRLLQLSLGLGFPQLGGLAIVTRRLEERSRLPVILDLGVEFPGAQEIAGLTVVTRGLAEPPQRFAQPGGGRKVLRPGGGAGLPGATSRRGGVLPLVRRLLAPRGCRAPARRPGEAEAFDPTATHLPAGRLACWTSSSTTTVRTTSRVPTPRMI
jgi:hypothetical protein